MTREEVIEKLLNFEQHNTKSHLTKEKAEKFVDYLDNHVLDISNYDDIHDLLMETGANDIEDISEKVGIPIGYINEGEYFVWTAYVNGEEILDVELFNLFDEDDLLEQGYTVDEISKIIGEKFDLSDGDRCVTQLHNFIDELCKNGIVIYN